MQNMYEIAKIIQSYGGTLYLVGGAIRDSLLRKEGLNIPVSDEDYCVAGISKEKFEEIFKQAKIQGKSFPVYILNGKEVALARTEKKIGKGHKEFEFNTSESITIEEDLARRDLTINSMAQNVITKELIDPFNGQEDLKNRILRKTTNSFKEDPLRVYRTARFAAILNSYLLKENQTFTVEPETLKAMESLKKELQTLSKERIFTEFKKALASNKPSVFFEVLRSANVLDVHFKEIAALIGQTQPEKYHPEGDSYNHTMIVVDNSAKLTNDLSIRFSALVHDLGKSVTSKLMLPHHYGHDEKGVKVVANFCRNLGVPTSWEKCGKVACKWHMKAGIFSKMTPSKQVDFIEHVSSSMLGLNGMKIVVACDRARTGLDLQKEFDSIIFDKIGKECLAKIDGNYIQKIYPNLAGEEFGKRLHEERVKWLKNKPK